MDTDKMLLKGVRTANTTLRVRFIVMPLLWTIYLWKLRLVAGKGNQPHLQP